MKSIFLIGFMGAGKTTVGKALGEEMNLPVLDTDEEIVKQENRSINEIFAKEGEGYFRQVESQILKDLPKEKMIITTGGGIILQGENRAYLQTNGTVIYLHAKIEELLFRLQNDQTRPLVRNGDKQEIIERYQKRLALYEQTCHIQIQTEGKSVAEIVTEINECLK
ncbi:shikimate kinase [Cytobacillus spongiae]|jgi:shikimate kinase|uniref:shikimate kinase n=1 Tax=Cytobacillus spongiae TaxID=2901381 RepID=UPI001F3A85B1|nr:shikimate kinase [Cytobacillus spongiae]UII54830.1 shikimate kinase [Cytobacillus spongiae]